MHLLRSDNLVETDPSYGKYLDSLSKVRNLIDHLYFEFMLNLDQQGEVSYYYKLFLHVLYEIESAVYYLRDMFHKERQTITEILTKEANKDRRSFEKIYLEFNMSTYFSKLLSWFEERREISGSSE